MREARRLEATQSYILLLRLSLSWTSRATATFFRLAGAHAPPQGLSPSLRMATIRRRQHGRDAFGGGRLEALTRCLPALAEVSAAPSRMTYESQGYGATTDIT